MSNKPGETNVTAAIGPTVRADYQVVSSTIREALKRQPQAVQEYVGNVLRRKQEGEI